MPAVDADKQRDNKRHPTLGDHVIVGAGAQILGPITVHRCARIGGNSVVTKDVPEGATVVGVPARQLSKTKALQNIGPDFMPYAVHDEAADLDPRERAIKALVDEVQNQRARITSLEDQLGAMSISAVSKPAASRAKPKTDR